MFENPGTYYRPCTLLIWYPIFEDPAKRLAAIQGAPARYYRWARERCSVIWPMPPVIWLPAAIRCFGAGCRTHPHGRQPATDQYGLSPIVPGIPWLNTRYFCGAAFRDVFPLVPVCDGMAISHGITESMIAFNLG